MLEKFYHDEHKKHSRHSLRNVIFIRALQMLGIGQVSYYHQFHTQRNVHQREEIFRTGLSRCMFFSGLCHCFPLSMDISCGTFYLVYRSSSWAPLNAEASFESFSSSLPPSIVILSLFRISRVSRDALTIVLCCMALIRISTPLSSILLP
jgi:hypothetical protein